MKDSAEQRQRIQERKESLEKEEQELRARAAQRKMEHEQIEIRRQREIKAHEKWLKN